MCAQKLTKMLNRDSILHIWKEGDNAWRAQRCSGLEHIATKIYQNLIYCVMEFENIERVCHKTESIDDLMKKFVKY